jgi:hypothetical protein
VDRRELGEPAHLLNKQNTENNSAVETIRIGKEKGGKKRNALYYQVMLQMPKMAARFQIWQL